jgi:uncharacterized protein YjbI with pentapeptide repeats
MSKRRVAGVFVVVVAGMVALGALIWLAYHQSWTGFGEYTGTVGEPAPGKTLWDWMDLLIVPAALALAVYWLNEQSREREREAESRQLDQTKKLLIFQMISPNNDIALDALGRLSSLFSLKDGVLQGADLRKANLSWSNLNGADLREADLREANLRGAFLRGTNLTGASLGKANLIGADMREAKLIEANLGEADLNNANLIGADLTGADLREAYLHGTELSKVDLRGADLRGAEMFGISLHESKCNENTKWAYGFDPEAAGAVLVSDE